MNAIHLFRTRKYRTLLPALCLLLAGCGSQPHAGGPPAFPPAPVPVITLEKTPVPEASDFMATLISRHSVTLAPQVAGQISNIFVKAGDVVRQGAPLLEIDPARQSATVQSAMATAAAKQADIEQARRTLATLEAQRQGEASSAATNESLYNRYNKLYTLKSASLQDVEKYHDQYLQSQATLNANQAQANAQKAAIEAARKQYEQALAAAQQEKVQLRYYTITAPFSGVVGDIPIKVGNYVQPLTNLLSVTDNKTLEVNLSIPSERIQDIAPGKTIEILDEAKHVLGSTTVSFVSPRVDSDTQTLLIKGILDNTAGRLKADQLVNARIVWRREPSILIPTTAVSHLGGRDFAFVAQTDAKGQSVARQVPITIDRFEGADYVVSQGLKPGDQLIISGIQKLMDGAPIKPTPQQASR